MESLESLIGGYKREVDILKKCVREDRPIIDSTNYYTPYSRIGASLTLFTHPILTWKRAKLIRRDYDKEK